MCIPVETNNLIAKSSSKKARSALYMTQSCHLGTLHEISKILRYGNLLVTPTESYNFFEKTGLQHALETLKRSIVFVGK